MCSYRACFYTTSCLASKLLHKQYDSTDFFTLSCRRLFSTPTTHHKLNRTCISHITYANTYKRYNVQCWWLLYVRDLMSIEMFYKYGWQTAERLIRNYSFSKTVALTSNEEKQQHSFFPAFDIVRYIRMEWLVLYWYCASQIDRVDWITLALNYSIEHRWNSAGYFAPKGQIAAFCSRPLSLSLWFHFVSLNTPTHTNPGFPKI